MLLGARHAPERLCGGVCLQRKGRYNKCSTFYLFISSDVGAVWRVNAKHTANNPTSEMCTFGIAVVTELTAPTSDGIRSV